MRRRLAHKLLCLVVASFVATGPADAQGRSRGLLWRVVQSCLVNHALFGGAFPCLAVEIAKGAERGYAVLRAPADDTRVIVTPTARTIGIEAERLRGSKAPNYFRDAWLSRHFVTDELEHKPHRDDLALAVNSRLGRSQDQLHIHIACIRPEVKKMLAQKAAAIRAADWLRIKALPRSPHYLVHFESGPDLAGLNLFDLAAAALNVDPDEMDDVTIVVVGAEPDGFMVLARKRLPHSLDQPHGEALLDPDCSAFRRP